ncbi:15148_t:CDS:1, partial [Racocetra persica]
DNQYLLPWNNIYLRTHKSPRGPIPFWYKYIKNLITNNLLPSVWPSIQLENINPFINTLTLTSTPSTISKKK